LNQLTEDSTGTTYSYDGGGRLDGEVNGSKETTFAWDPLDHLAKAETSGGVVTYAFDALERLSERESGEATQLSHYGDLGDMPTYEADGEGKTTISYVQGPRGLVEQRSGEATSFPLVDGHGDVTAVTSPAGEVASRQSFNPWGHKQILADCYSGGRTGRTIGGVVGGGAGFGIGAASGSELGPLGAAGVGTVSGTAGAGIGGSAGTIGGCAIGTIGGLVP
jgi:uncharacterized protein RhaS with RHS repeats